jgi:hypothetical protein
MRGIGSNGLDLGTFYYERVDVSQPFGPPHYVATVPHDAQDPFMTNDCGRIYFDALDTVLYVDQ